MDSFACSVCDLLLLALVIYFSPKENKNKKLNNNQRRKERERRNKNKNNNNRIANSNANNSTKKKMKKNVKHATCTHAHKLSISLSFSLPLSPPSLLANIALLLSSRLVPLFLLAFPLNSQQFAHSLCTLFLFCLRICGFKKKKKTTKQTRNKFPKI